MQRIPVWCTLDQQWYMSAIYECCSSNYAFPKVPPGTEFWQRHNSEICKQPIIIEKTCSTQFWRHPPSKILFMHPWSCYAMADHISQCAIPIFDGLLPEPHNTAVLKLLFTCEYWHGLAKLHPHIEDTLNLLDVEMVQIGKELQAFIKNMCKFYDTWELKWEVEACKWRKAKKGADAQASSGAKSNNQATEPSTDAEEDEPTSKKLSINTYKAHSLRDYTQTIHWLGTTDSYSTVIVGDYLIMIAVSYTHFFLS